MTCKPLTGVAFEDYPDGRRFVVQWTPERRDPHRTLVLIPPFGEEMNKSRRTIALAARRFASDGMAVYAADLAGTGDSEGDFGAATWDQWTADVEFAIKTAEARFSAPVTLWAVRAGSLILPGLRHVPGDVLLWQPVTSGDAFLTQLLRIKVANDAFSGREGTTTKQLRSLLTGGETLEIAGYELSPRLVLPMAAVGLQAWAPGSRRVIWIETGGESVSFPPPASQRVVQTWAEGGTSVELRHATGEQFWLTQEIAENQAIAQASIEVMEAVDR